MKTKFIIALVMLFCFSCAHNKPLSNPAKENVISEVKDVLASIVKGIEQVNAEAITSTLLSTSEFTFQINGNTGDYDQYTKAVSAYFAPLASQKIEFFNERYAVMDHTTVLYSSNFKCEMTFKDGKVVLQDPYALQFLFRKKGNQWKLASWTEYGSEKTLKAGNTARNLDPLDLLRQFTGAWIEDEGPVQ